MAEIRSNGEVSGIVESIEDLHKDLTGAIKALNSSFHRIVPILVDRSIFEDSFTVGGHKPRITEVVKKSTALGNILTAYDVYIQLRENLRTRKTLLRWLLTL